MKASVSTLMLVSWKYFLYSESNVIFHPGFFDHGQKYTAESRCGDQKNVKVLLRHSPSGGNFIRELKNGKKEYFSSNVVYKEVFPLAKGRL